MSNIYLTVLILMQFIVVFGTLWYVKGKIFNKLLILTLVGLMVVLTYQSFESYKGYPSKDLPDGGNVIAIRGNVEAHEVYVWLSEEDRGNKKPSFIDRFLYSVDNQQPRAYIIGKLSDEDMKKWLDAAQKVSKGYHISFKIKKSQIDKNGNMGDGILMTPELHVRTSEELMPKH